MKGRLDDEGPFDSGLDAPWRISEEPPIFRIPRPERLDSGAKRVWPRRPGGSQRTAGQ